MNPKKRCLPLLAAGLSLILSACLIPASPSYQGPARTFASSFEDESDFSAFWTERGDAFASAQTLDASEARDGGLSHKAWITAARAPDNDGLEYRPHRAYPTIQLQKTAEGVYRSPCLVSLWVWLDMELAEKPAGKIDDWFSFATLCPVSGELWPRVVAVNIVHEGYVHLMHVPDQGLQERLYQAGAANDPHGALKFPMRRWVRLDIFIDFDAVKGYAKVWQDGRLVSHALVRGGNGALAQAHFGLYASAAVAAGTIRNDKLRIREVSGEAEALGLVEADW